MHLLRIPLHNTPYLLGCDHGRCRCYEKINISQVLQNSGHSRCLPTRDIPLLLHAIPSHPIPSHAPVHGSQPNPQWGVSGQSGHTPPQTVSPKPVLLFLFRLSSLKYLSLQCCTSYPLVHWGLDSVCPSKSPGWTRLQQLWQLAFSLLLSLCIVFHISKTSPQQKPQQHHHQHPIFQSLTLSSSLPIRNPTWEKIRDHPGDAVHVLPTPPIVYLTVDLSNSRGPFGTSENR
ncbi:hypothetical protein BDP55DRAFT_63167 [Colletotrichum godetiae]|uniref:Uncharacterized protein n=1 Tax=Colletotrichum godetiae TaxID=1209918 RepID=A0AAJ0AQ28_9PEZI|nr:uncharacterized protein BDP55DRAFT_63167 [Colletotrichum godetiae]KAK1688281.1 hypothetical protein BDP55DRAFT_63167 [Colletotrichum godetiae]